MLQEVRTMLLRKLVCVLASWFVYLYNDSILLHFSTLHYNCQFLICPCEYTSHPQGAKLEISRKWSEIKTKKTSNSKITTTANGNSKRNNKGNNSKLVAYKWKTMICSPIATFLSIANHSITTKTNYCTCSTLQN